MSKVYSDQQLQSYLDESLSAELMSSIEEHLRGDEDLRNRLVRVAGLREAGVHGLGEIWRRQRLSCPTREQLGSYVLKAMDSDTESYIRFHLEDVGCRLCRANLDDLESRRSDQQQQASQTRRQRYFQTSVGHLSRQRKTP